MSESVGKPVTAKPPPSAATGLEDFARRDSLEELDEQREQQERDTLRREHAALLKRQEEERIRDEARKARADAELRKAFEAAKAKVHERLAVDEKQLEQMWVSLQTVYDVMDDYISAANRAFRAYFTAHPKEREALARYDQLTGKLRMTCLMFKRDYEMKRDERTYGAAEVLQVQADLIRSLEREARSIDKYFPELDAKDFGKGLRERDDLDAKICTEFGCTREQVAHGPREIDADTKVYVGNLFPEVFQRLRHVEHIYTRYPNDKIERMSVHLGTFRTREERALHLKDAGIVISDKDLDAIPLTDTSGDVDLILIPWSMPEGVLLSGSDPKIKAGYRRLQDARVRASYEGTVANGSYMKWLVDSAEYFGLSECPPEAILTLASTSSPDKSAELARRNIVAGSRPFRPGPLRPWSVFVYWRRGYEGPDAINQLKFQRLADFDPVWGCQVAFVIPKEE